MVGYLRTSVRKPPIIALYFEFEIVLKFYNLQARPLPAEFKPWWFLARRDMSEDNEMNVANLLILRHGTK